MKIRTGAETLIFWGAGATASTGFKTTVFQSRLIKQLVGQKTDEAIAERIGKLKLSSIEWESPLTDLLLVLGDDAGKNIHIISPEASAAMGRHWRDQSQEALQARIHELRTLFDWAALKDVVRICPGFGTEDKLQLQDIFNILDLHAQNFHGFLGLENYFLSPARLISARRALQLILNTLFYIDWHCSLDVNQKGRKEVNKHLEFARLLAKHHQDQGLALAGRRSYFDSRNFYLGDIAFCSLNYDPLALWAQFIANKEANNNPPHIDFPCVPMKIFHDFGIFMAVSTIDGQNQNETESKERVWYPLNEASAQRLNDRDHATGRRVRINKFLFPHGCLCWRECPSCGKLSSYMGKEWNMFSPALIPPPPLRGFSESGGAKLRPETSEEQDAWDRGEVDARSCVHCGELTFAQHTQAIMQSNFKSAPPSFIEEVQRDLRVATQAANHIILMGYSLPPDDVAYRAFFAARKKRYTQKDKENPVRCSVVVGNEFADQWYYNKEIEELFNSDQKMKLGKSERNTLDAACDIFDVENVRFYGGGIPRVFCEGDTVTESRFNQLINWD